MFNSIHTKMVTIIKSSLIRTVLVCMVLVVGTSLSFHLFGQQGNGLSGKKDGQSNATSAAAGVETQTPVDGDLVEYVTKHYEDVENNSTIAQYLVSPKNDAIIFLLVHANDVIQGNVNGVETSGYSYDLLYYKNGVHGVKKIASNSSFFKNVTLFVQPKAWLADNKVILEAYDDVFHEHEGLVLYDLQTDTGNILPVPKNYNGFRLIGNRSKIFYSFSSTGEYQKDEQGYDVESTLHIDSHGVYDLKTKENLFFKSVPPELQRELEQENQSSAKSLDPQSQTFSIDAITAHGCALSGVPIMYLPWPCNKAMLVQRDGPVQCPGANCLGSNPSHDWATEYSDCALSIGSSYANASGGCPTSCGHSRPAIDFGDGALWFQTGTPILAVADGQVQLKVDANTTSGGGNMLIIRHPKSGGGYAYTYCMHAANGSIPSWIPNATTGNWASVTRGTKIGLEGGTGGNYSPHYHFELKSSIGGDSYYPVFMEYGGCTPKNGYSYISKNVPTDGSMQLGFDCNNVINLSCSSASQTLSGQTTVGKSSRFASYGNGYHSWDEYGPEQVYKITTTQTGTISVSLSNVTYSNGNDLDVFILRNPSSTSCGDLDPLHHTVGTSSGLSSTYANAPAGTYYIVVDGMNGSSGTYTITVTSPCSGSGGGGTSSSLPNLTEYGSSYTSNGNTLTITAKPVNYGLVAAGAFSIGYWLSTDNLLSNNDIGIVSLTYSSLAANSYSTYTFSVNTSGIASMGNYYILFKIDYLNQVVESSESDNLWMFNQQYYLPTSISSKLNPVLTPIKEIVAGGIDYLIDNEEWTDRYDETQLLYQNEQEESTWLWKDTYDRWVVSVKSSDIITITDITGKVIETLESREDAELWLPKLPTGMYIVTICCDGEHKEKIGKIVY